MEFSRQELRTIYMVFSSNLVPAGIKEKIEQLYTQCPFCGDLFLHEEIEEHRSTSTCNDDEILE